jgi:hypothetical protein
MYSLSLFILQYMNNGFNTVFDHICGSAYIFFFIILKKAIQEADHGFDLYKTILQMWSAFAYGPVWTIHFTVQKHINNNIG